MNPTRAARITGSASSVTTAVLTAGVLAATLDAGAGLLPVYFVYHRSPLFFFQFVASGVLGKPAFAGGVPVAMLGAAIHSAIALVWAGLFFAACSVPHLRKPKVRVAGPVYGFVIWSVMNLLVLPLSRVPKIPFQPVRGIVDALIVIMTVSVPIVIIARRHYSIWSASEAP